MIARAPSRAAVLVILAANVFVAPFRAIAWALAQSERVIVRKTTVYEEQVVTADVRRERVEIVTDGDVRVHDGPEG